MTVKRTKGGIDRQHKVYLLHIGRKVGRPPKSPKALGEKCFHYVGTTNALMRRFSEHVNCNNGSKMIEHAKTMGLSIEIARVWVNKTENFERFLKDTKNIPRYCPICNPEKYIGKAGSKNSMTVKERWDKYWKLKGRKNGDRRY